MKVTRRQLKNLIREVLNEQDTGDTGSAGDTGQYGREKSWTDNPTKVLENIDEYWFPREVKTWYEGAGDGDWVDMTGNDYWFVTHGVGGLNQEHHKKTGWAWFKVALDGIYYTPKTPGGRVGDLSNKDDPDIGFAAMNLSHKNITSYKLTQIFWRWSPGSDPAKMKAGLGVEGTICGKVGPVSGCDENGKREGLANVADMRKIIGSLVSTGRGSITKTIEGRPLTVTWG